MEYKYLAEWVRQSPRKRDNSLYVEDICRWENQVFIFFSHKNEYLHINLEGNPYLFFADRKLLEKCLCTRLKGFYSHIKGAAINDISLKTDDRVISIHCRKKNMYGEIENMVLIAEMIPRNTNLILAKEDSGGSGKNKSGNLYVIDCLRAVSFTDSSRRAVLPGQKYEYPPVSGFSLTSSDVQYPLSVDSGGKIVASKLIKAGADNGFNDMDSLFGYLFFDVYLTKRGKQFKQSTIKQLRNQIRKLERKKFKLKKELEEYQDADLYKIKAELIKYNLNKIRPGMEKIKLTNYYQNPPSDIEVELIPEKSALQNMHHYFKKYRKSISGREMKQQQLVRTDDDIDHTERRITDIEDTDYSADALFSFSSQKSGKSKAQPAANRYKKIRVGADWEIFVGRTAKENDELTCKMAKPNDWWFHSRIYQGSHIILRNYAQKQVTDELVLICCRLAAYYSKAKHSSNVPVDYTQVRYVTKPHKSPPGFVIYKHQKTVFVNPLSFREVSAVINSS